LCSLFYGHGLEPKVFWAALADGALVIPLQGSCFDQGEHLTAWIQMGDWCGIASATGKTRNNGRETDALAQEMATLKAKILILFCRRDLFT